MRSIYRPDFFDNVTFEKIKKYVIENLEAEGVVSYAKIFKKYYGIVFLPEDIKDILLPLAQAETGDNSLEIIYSQIVKYQIKDGVYPELPKHKDRVNGEWVMDIVIDGTVNWPLVIEDKSFDNLPNSVIFIRGEDEFHERPDFPSSNESDYILLLFVHLADKDSHYAKTSRDIFEMKEEDVKSFLKAVKPAWGY
jgi:hypothetical protein